MRVTTMIEGGVSRPVSSLQNLPKGAIRPGKIRLTSSNLPKWAQRTKSLDALLPVL